MHTVNISGPMFMQLSRIDCVYIIQKSYSGLKRNEWPRRCSCYVWISGELTLNDAGWLTGDELRTLMIEGHWYLTKCSFCVNSSLWCVIMFVFQTRNLVFIELGAFKVESFNVLALFLKSTCSVFIVVFPFDFTLIDWLVCNWI